MKLALADPEALRKLATEAYANAPFGDEIVVEALRAELAARRVANRRSLCERVRSHLAPVHETTPEAVRVALEALEKARDATLGPGGFVAASPVRAVPIGAGRFRLFGTPPSSWLCRELGVAVHPSSWGRLSEPPDAVAFAGAVERIGGAVLPPERWAGFDSVLPAGPAWLELLSGDLENLGPGDGVTSTEADAEWRVYRPSARGEVSVSLWYRAAPGDTGRLWRTKTESGWFQYALTAGGEPMAGRDLRLREDDALRTQFALDRKADCPQVLSVEKAGARSLLELTVFLPRAEYRYLATVGEPADLTSGKRVLAFPASVWDAVEGTLRERLGVEIDERGA